jgi:hypothetical protein
MSENETKGYNENIGKKMPTREQLYGKHTGFITISREEYEQLQQLKEDYAELETRHNQSFNDFKSLKNENDFLRENHRKNSEKTIKVLDKVVVILASGFHCEAGKKNDIYVTNKYVEMAIAQAVKELEGNNRHENI